MRRAVRYRLPGPQDKPRAVEAMFDRIAGRYDLVNRLMTFGLDVGWRRRTVAALSLPAGAVVADLACGTGDLCRELERAGYRAVGFDFSARMLGEARRGSALVRADVLRLPAGDGAVDGAVCGFALRNVADPAELFHEAARAVRPGGRVALLEVAQPENRLARWGHRVHLTRIVPFVGGLLSDRDAYRYLPASVAYLPSPQALEGMLAEAGFTGMRRTLVGLGAAQIVEATRAG